MEQQSNLQVQRLRNLQISASLETANVIAPLFRLLELRKQTARVFCETDRLDHKDLVEQQIEMINHNIKELLGI